MLWAALGQFWVDTKGVWAHLSPNAKVNIGIAALATVVGIIAIVIGFSGTQYVRLYTRIDMKDASTIITHLGEQGEDYKLEDGNRTILVPVNRVADIRMSLSDADLVPKFQGGVAGFELLEKQDLLSNRWLQDMNYMRALQGELQRQLNEFDFITSSRVFISEAKEELFVDDQKPSKAAVTLDVTHRPSKIEVKAILGIVSSFGGPNLNPSNITLTTTDGTLLHLPPTDKFASIANSKLEFKTEVERERADKIRRAFEEMGKKAVVSVSADVSWDSIKKRENMATEGPALSSWSVTSTTTSNEGPPEGPTGAVQNIPGGMGQPGNFQTSTEEEQTIDNYQPSTTVTETLTEPGNVSKYNVTAIIETDYQTAAAADGNETIEPVPLTPEKITAYKSLIASAMGEGTLTTDVSVFDHPFRTAAVGVLAAGMVPEKVTLWSQKGIITIGQLLGLAMFFLWFRWRLRKAILVPTEEVEVVEEVAEIPLASPEDLRRQEIAAEVERLAVEDPDAVAALLRSWMAEEE